LDAEFNNVKTSLDATQSRLAELQRDDGALRNLIVTRDSLSTDVLTALEAGAQGAMTTEQVAVLTLANQAALNAATASAAASAASAANSYALTTAVVANGASTTQVANLTTLAVQALASANQAILSTQGLACLSGNTFTSAQIGGPTSTSPISPFELVAKKYVNDNTLSLSAVAATTSQTLVYTLETDGIQRWKPTDPSLLSGSLAERCKFDGALANCTTKSGTHVRTGTDVTVTITGHGLLVNHMVYLNFTTGALDGTYVVQSVTDANTFHVTTVASGSISSNPVQFLECAQAYTTGMKVLAGGQTANGAYIINLRGTYGNGFFPVMTTSFRTSGGADTDASAALPDYSNTTGANINRTANSIVYSVVNLSGAARETGVNSSVLIF